jgi:hypothetical protein
MTITIKPARTPGRVIIESDGCSAYYGGALVQGATICRISAPAALAEKYRDRDGDFDMTWFERNLAFARSGEWKRSEMAGVRVLERRIVQ